MSDWASWAIQQLQRGQMVAIRPRGHSMRGLIADGQRVTLAPLQAGEPRVGDVVLCRVRGRTMLHRVHAVGPRGYAIANARGHLNGWCPRTQIFGRWTGGPRHSAPRSL